MSAQDHLNSEQFYHASDHEYKAGDHVLPPAELNPDNPRKAFTNPAYGSRPRRTDTTFFTDDQYQAGDWGKNTYKVRPLGSQTWDDPSAGGEPGYFEHQGHLEILGKAE